MPAVCWGTLTMRADAQHNQHPRLARVPQGPQVEYSLRAIPLGGYVGFPDDDPESPYPPDDPDLLRNKVRLFAGLRFFPCAWCA